jgi:hypothetical protein
MGENDNKYIVHTPYYIQGDIIYIGMYFITCKSDRWVKMIING